MMSKQENMALVYWDIVLDCLVEILDVDPRHAALLLADFRKSIRSDSEPEAREFVYHEEPLYLACNLVGKEAAREFEAKYGRILKRHGW